MKQALVIFVVAGGLFAGVLSAADGGRIAFRGSIVEPSCPAGALGVDCPAGREGAAVSDRLDLSQSPTMGEPELLAYARSRDPMQHWQLVAITYR